ncbi:MAG TPA: RNA polymerase sigma factor [Verrucomicrobiae bacterium]|nr:RNA polymerase sigma factor [Verrucomicrobiae bacterium]
MSQETEFQRLVDQHYSSLYRFAFSLTRQESDACDLTQETFYIWARKGHQVRDERKVKSWLFTTLHREYLQKHRRISRFPEIELTAAEPELPEISAATPERFDRESVLGALGKLDQNFRSVLALFYLEDYSYPEIAEVLNIPLGTVKSRISRGIAQLQVLLIEPQLAPVGTEATEVSRG